MFEIFGQENYEKAVQQLAEFAEKKGFTFSKFETIGNDIVMQAGTRWEHDSIVDLIRTQIPRPRFSKLTNVDLLLTAEPQQPIPDLVVVPEPLEPGAKPWAHETELLVEVVSQSNYRADYEGKKLRYAVSGAPQFLLVDPRESVCVLHSKPNKARETYDDAVTTKFGQPISGMICMDGADLDTTEFPRYL